MEKPADLGATVEQKTVRGVRGLWRSRNKEYTKFGGGLGGHDRKRP